METATLCKHSEESLLLCVWKQVIAEMGKSLWMAFKKKKKEKMGFCSGREMERTVGHRRTEMVGGCVRDGSGKGYKLFSSASKSETFSWVNGDKGPRGSQGTATFECQ